MASRYLHRRGHARAQKPTGQLVWLVVLVGFVVLIYVTVNSLGRIGGVVAAFTKSLDKGIRVPLTLNSEIDRVGSRIRQAHVEIQRIQKAIQHDQKLLGDMDSIRQNRGSLSGELTEVWTRTVASLEKLRAKEAERLEKINGDISAFNQGVAEAKIKAAEVPLVAPISKTEVEVEALKR